MCASRHTFSRNLKPCQEGSALRRATRANANNWVALSRDVCATHCRRQSRNLWTLERCTTVPCIRNWRAGLWTRTDSESRTLRTRQRERSTARVCAAPRPPIPDRDAGELPHHSAPHHHTRWQCVHACPPALPQPHARVVCVQPGLQRPTRVTDADTPVERNGFFRVHLQPKRFPRAYDVDWRARILADAPDFVAVNKPWGVQVTSRVDNSLESVVACAGEVRRSQSLRSSVPCHLCHALEQALADRSTYVNR